MNALEVLGFGISERLSGELKTNVGMASPSVNVVSEEYAPCDSFLWQRLSLGFLCFLQVCNVVSMSSCNVVSTLTSWALCNVGLLLNLWLLHFTRKLK